MAIFEIPGIKISGISACIPPQKVFTADYKKISESEQKMFIKTVGVESRRVAGKGVTTLDLCVKAAKKLLLDMNWEKEEIGLEIFVTQSNDYYLPSNATIAQHQLGLTKNCMAFDIGMGCSGYIYGLSVAASILKSTGIRRALLLAGDVSSVNCAYEDKSTYPLFGDAGTATAIENISSDTTVMHENSPWCFNLFSDGSRFDSIMIPDGGLRNLISRDSSFEYSDFEGGISRAPLHLALKTTDIFNFSITEVPVSINDLLRHTGRTISDFDYFILHQANKLINETIRKKLGIEKEKLPYSIHQYGNTSSASIPITIASALGNEAGSKKLSLLLSGFGVGLSWGNVSLSVNGLICPQVIDF